MVADLKKREKNLIEEKQQTEAEYGKQRAKIKGIFISKEGKFEADIMWRCRPLTYYITMWL